MHDLLFARLQMAVSLAFHIVFAAIGIALPALMAIAEFIHLRTGSKVALALAKRWSKGAAILFAVGAVSGTVLSFELGLLWPRFMEHAGAIIGVPFGLEGFAFFTEAIFLGIYLYAWNRVHPWVHWASGVIVAISGAASAIFVIMANAWMNAPTGFDYDPATRTFSNIDPIAAMFNDAWLPQGIHMLAAAYLATAAAVAGVHAWRLLKHPASEFHRTALRIALIVAAPMALIQPLTGDFAAKVVARHQPIKLAAMEGLWNTQRRAPLTIGGIPDERTETTNYAIEIPAMLSFLAYSDFNAEVKGLKDFPRDDRPPVAITHLSFQLMVACGTALIFTTLWGAFAMWRTRDRAGLRPQASGPELKSAVASSGNHARPLPRAPLIALALAAPLGFAAIEFGWCVTEVGRQPWIIHAVMRTSEAVTPMPGLLAPFLTFTAIYVVLAIVVTTIMLHQFRAADKDAH